mgnify:CR=1 FL=1
MPLAQKGLRMLDSSWPNAYLETVVAESDYVAAGDDGRYLYGLAVEVSAVSRV